MAHVLILEISVKSCTKISAEKVVSSGIDKDPVRQDLDSIEPYPSYGYLQLRSKGLKSSTSMEKDHSIKTVQAKGASISHSSGGKIPSVNAMSVILYSNGADS